MDKSKELNVIMYDVKEMAEVLGVTPRTIMRYLKDGKLTGAIKVGGKWKISKDNLEAYLNGQTLSPIYTK